MSSALSGFDVSSGKTFHSLPVVNDSRRMIERYKTGVARALNAVDTSQTFLTSFKSPS